VITDSLSWLSPLDAARALGQDEEQWVLLYSGTRTSYSGHYSYLALYPQEIISGNELALLNGKLGTSLPPLQNSWFGYFGYEMLHNSIKAAVEKNSYITLPNLWFARFGLILCFDHQKEIVTCYRKPHIALPKWPVQNDATHIPSPLKAGGIKELTSSMSRDEYLDIISKTKKAINRGDFYQANITRKFTGKFVEQPKPFDIFCSLSEASPAAYSAYIQIGDKTILSSSPERFLNINAEGHIESRPIKGTAPRFADKKRDDDSRKQLENSVKDRAENLMIVDLMRNDISQAAIAGSIKVEQLFEVSSYATLHHMASTVSGVKRADISTLETVQYCFPPGSMTGAPKMRAVEWCLEQEKMRRGVYSGTLGWFGGDGSCDLSVIIRTLIIESNRFEFQVGGGIVADSDPIEEWQETITKARGILVALGIETEVLEAL
jgi:anthranilate/para-aminobenzoate synthase component I